MVARVEKDPATRKRVAAEMRTESDAWENLLLAAGGAENVLIVELRDPGLKAKYMGKTLAEIAKLRGTSPEEGASFARAEFEKWKKVIAEGKIKPE